MSVVKMKWVLLLISYLSMAVDGKTKLQFGGHKAQFCQYLWCGVVCDEITGVTLQVASTREVAGDAAGEDLLKTGLLKIIMLLLTRQDLQGPPLPLPCRLDLPDEWATIIW